MKDFSLCLRLQKYTWMSIWIEMSGSTNQVRPFFFPLLESLYFLLYFEKNLSSTSSSAFPFRLPWILIESYIDYRFFKFLIFLTLFRCISNRNSQTNWIAGIAKVSKYSLIETDFAILVKKIDDGLCWKKEFMMFSRIKKKLRGARDLEKNLFRVRHSNTKIFLDTSNRFRATRAENITELNCNIFSYWHLWKNEPFWKCWVGVDYPMHYSFKICIQWKTRRDVSQASVIGTLTLLEINES